MDNYFVRELREIDACDDAIEWAETNDINSFVEAWDECPRADWMLWLHSHDVIRIYEHTLRLFACQCVRETPIGNGKTVWDLLTDQRSRDAVEVAERYANGNASENELSSAWNIAYIIPSEVKSASEYSAAWSAAWCALPILNYSSALKATICAASRMLSTEKNASEWRTSLSAANKFQADLLRKIVGNPFIMETSK
jgi:hypothetical protein